MTEDTRIVLTEPQLGAKHAELEALSRIVGALNIRTEAEVQSATAFVQGIKAQWKELDEERKSYTKPWRDKEAHINQLYKPLLGLLERAEKTVKDNIAKFLLAQRQAQVAALQAASDAHRAGDHAAVQTALAVSNATVTQAPKGVSVREVWTADVVDANAVPREWCVPDEQRIKATARSTPAEVQPAPIPGVVFRLVPSTTVRA